MLSGQMLKEGILSASNHLGAHRGEVDALNVFPVPDGDTGTNMAMTVAAAARELQQLGGDCDFDVMADCVASAMLRGARGNSGVILSLIFRGIAKGVKGLKNVDSQALANALMLGSEAAYKAVMKPTEGTILTVARESAQKAREAAQKSQPAAEVFRAALDGARESLAKTPAMLPVLRQAGVVDAGGQGYVYIMEGLLQGFTGDAELAEFVPVTQPRSVLSPAAASMEDIEFTYCTEFLIEKTPGALEDIEPLRAALATLGDCVVIVEDDDIIKVHVHNNQPGDVLNLAQQYGQFVQMKIENMRRQHEEAAWTQPGAQGIAAAEKPYGVVAVATGSGIAQMYREIGADAIVEGGQSMNPSTEDILKAVNQVPAEHVFILPNNKNIIMAAEQVAPLTSRGVSVVPTRSIVEGVSALLEFDPESDAQANHLQMQRAAEQVQTGLVTYAARDSRINGLEIKKNAVIGLENGKLTVVEHDIVTAAYRVARHLVRRFNGSMITIYAGEEVTEAQTQKLTDMLSKRYGGDVDISTAQGGQPVYYYMIAVE